MKYNNVVFSGLHRLFEIISLTSVIPARRTYLYMSEFLSSVPFLDCNRKKTDQGARVGKMSFSGMF